MSSDPGATRVVGPLSADEVMSIVRAAIVRVLEVDPQVVTRGSRLVEDLGADSLALVEIVEISEEEIAAAAPGFRIPDDVLDALVTVGEAVDYAVAQL